MLVVVNVSTSSVFMFVMQFTILLLPKEVNTLSSIMMSISVLLLNALTELSCDL